MTRGPRHVVVGVDGGGTKTHAIVATTDGELLGLGASGPSNWEIVGLDGMQTAVGEAVAAALTEAQIHRDVVAASAYALAGCDWPSDETRLAAGVDELRVSGHRIVVNDAVAVLHAGTRSGYGIASVAGTGGSTTGRNRAGERFRTFAVSIGEAAGASGIARLGIEAMAREYHGQIEATTLSSRILAATSYRSVGEMFEAISRGHSRGVGPQLAPVIFAAADEGDACAQEITVNAAADHARDVVGVARRLAMLDDTFDVVCSGGVHTAGNVAFDSAFRSALASEIPTAIPTLLVHPPVFGAVLLALNLVGIASESSRNQLEILMSEIR